MVPQNLTIEELLALAEQKVETKTELNYKEVKRFCDEFNLSKGHDTVHLNLIYYNYYNWERGTKMHPKTFSKFLKAQFKHKYKKKIGMYYFLNKKKLPFDFKPTTIMTANIFVRNLYEKENTKIEKKERSSNK